MKNTKNAVSNTHIVSRATFVSDSCAQLYNGDIVASPHFRILGARADCRRMTNSIDDAHLATAPPPLPAVVMLPARWFVLGCAGVAAAILIAGRAVPMPPGLLGAEVLATILSLFVSRLVPLPGPQERADLRDAARHRRDVLRTAHVGVARGARGARLAALAARPSPVVPRPRRSVHADTMLFILGLTLFVAVIAQTRLLEGMTYVLLRRYRGAIQPTVIAVTAAVAVASGILGGVSLISLTIRTLVIILMLAAAPVSAIRYAIMLCTAVTTICGVFSAYGEPPNLIMKANLAPHLGNDFFLYYCGPVALVSYLVVAWQLRRKLRGRRIDLDGDGRDRRQRRRRAVPPGDAAWRSADARRAHRGARGGAGRRGRPAARARAPRRVARDRAGARGRTRADAEAVARALRQRGSRRRARSALCARRGRRSRGRAQRRARGRQRGATISACAGAARSASAAWRSFRSR